MKKIQTYIQELESNFDAINVSNSAISDSSVGWHLDHCLKVITVILDAVEKSDPLIYKYNFNLKRTLVFLSGNIPRGKAKAPKIVHASATILVNDLKNQLQLATLLLKKSKDFDKNQHFLHPFFGVLNVKHTLKMLEIHTNHHLKIINDIKNH